VPLWALPFLPPWPLVVVALFLAMLSAPLVNGPIFGVLTKRTPENLRAKTLTAVVAINTVAAPLGYVAAGQILEHWGVVPLFTVVVLGVTWVAIAFTAIVLRAATSTSWPSRLRSEASHTFGVRRCRTVAG
jgi:small neutral amino acid transporter SnatA (MarC family)